MLVLQLLTTALLAAFQGPAPDARPLSDEVLRSIPLELRGEVIENERFVSRMTLAMQSGGKNPFARCAPGDLVFAFPPAPFFSVDQREVLFVRQQAFAPGLKVESIGRTFSGGRVTLTDGYRRLAPFLGPRHISGSDGRRPHRAGFVLAQELPSLDPGQRYSEADLAAVAWVTELPDPSSIDPALEAPEGYVIPHPLALDGERGELLVWLPPAWDGVPISEALDVTLTIRNGVEGWAEDVVEIRPGVTPAIKFGGIPVGAVVELEIDGTLTAFDPHSWVFAGPRNAREMVKITLQEAWFPLEDALTVTGRLVDEGGDPIANQSFSLHAVESADQTMSRETFWLVTDADGNFVWRTTRELDTARLSIGFGGIGHYGMHRAPTFVDGFDAPVRYSGETAPISWSGHAKTISGSARSIAVGDVTMVADEAPAILERRLSGRVLDPSGQPVQGAEVRALTVLRPGGGWYSSTYEIELETDLDGRFEADFHSLDNGGELVVQVVHPYFHTLRVPLDGPYVEDLDLTLAPIASLRASWDVPEDLASVMPDWGWGLNVTSDRQHHDLSGEVFVRFLPPPQQTLALHIPNSVWAGRANVWEHKTGNPEQVLVWSRTVEARGTEPLDLGELDPTAALRYIQLQISATGGKPIQPTWFDVVRTENDEVLFKTPLVLGDGLLDLVVSLDWGALELRTPGHDPIRLTSDLYREAIDMAVSDPVTLVPSSR